MGLKKFSDHQGFLKEQSNTIYDDNFQLAAQTTAPTDSLLASGRFYYDSTEGKFKFYQNGSWAYLGSTSSGTGVGDLDGAYSNGASITVDEGPITLTDASAGSLNTLALVKSGAGSGNVIDMGINAALTGNAIDIDMNLGIAAGAIYIDNGGTARTGADIKVKDDSTGAHSVIDIDKSGAGTSIGIDITSTYAGSPAGSFISLTSENGASLDTNGILVTRGTGVMAAPVLNIDDASTGSADVIDVDLSGVYTGNIFGFASSAAATGNVCNFVMDNAVAMTALRIAGAGARTQPFIELIGTQTGSADMIDLSADGAFTGDFVAIDMNAAVGANAIFIDGGAATRTAPLMLVTFDGDGTTTGGTFLDLNVTNTGGAANPLFDIDVTGVYTGNIFDVALGAASTGAVINVDMNLGLAAPFLALDYGNGTRTEDVVQVTFDGDGAAPFCDINITNTGAGGTSDLFDIDVTGIYTGSILDVVYGAAATGTAVILNMTSAVAAPALALTGAGARTDDLIQIDDASTGAGARSIFDINTTGNGTFAVLDISQGNSAVNVSPIVITRGTGANAAAAIFINDGGTTSAGEIDINVTGIATTAAVFDITYSAAATNDAIAVTMANSVAGSAIVLSGTGIRTDDLIKIDSDDTGAAMDFDVNLSGAGSGNFLDVTYSVGADTGNAIDLNMGTNVAGMAISVASAATGTDGEGSALDVAHTGDLIAGADLVRIASTGNISATSNLLAIEQSTGAGSAGAYGLYINCTGTNVEAIKVDAGAVVLDETLSVTGASTLSTVLYKDLTEVVAGANVITAAETGSVFFLSSAAEFESTLPAPAAGLHFTFIVSAAPAGASYTITTNAGANIIVGNAVSAEDAAGSVDFEASGCDTITFADGKAVKGDSLEVYCDGTNWYAYGTCSVQDAITFTTAA